MKNLILLFTFFCLSAHAVLTPVGSGGGGGAWGEITGTLSDQTDLQSALDLKAPLADSTAFKVGPGRQYTSISAALTAIGNGASAADLKQPIAVYIAGGIYDEDLTIPTGRIITLVAEGTVILGNGAGTNWSSTNSRNVTFTANNANAFGTDLKPALNIMALAGADPTSTFLAEAGIFRISGALNIAGDGLSHTINLSNTEIDGTVTKTAAGLTNLQGYKLLVKGAVNAGTATILERCYDCQFDALVTVDGYNAIINSEIKAGMTVTTNFNTLPPSGFFNTTFTGVFTGPANSLKLDSASEYFFRTNGATLGGSASKVAIMPNISSKSLFVSKDGLDTNPCSFNLPCLTIQKAIDVATAIPSTFNTPVKIEIHPGKYTENLSITQQGITLGCSAVLYHSDACQLYGGITINLSGTAGGGNFVAGNNNVSINGLEVFASGSKHAITFSGTAFQRLFINQSFINQTTTSSAFSALLMSNTGTSGGTKSTITARDTDFSNNSTTNATIEIQAGRMFDNGSALDLSNGQASGLSILISGSAAAGPSMYVDGATIVGQASITDNTAILQFSNVALSSGSNPCISTPSSPSTGFFIGGANIFTTTNTNVISGSGVAVLSGSNFLGSTGIAIASTVTLAPLAQLPQGIIKPAGVRLSGTGAQPTCAVGNRGLLWNIQGGAGVADILQVCQKNASDLYAWVTL